MSITTGWTRQARTQGSAAGERQGVGPAGAMTAGGLLLAAGTYMIYRGVSGRGAPGPVMPIDAEARITVNKPPTEVYRFWRELENLPRFMANLVRVEQVAPAAYRWTARLPAPWRREFTWEARVTEDDEGRWIAWRSDQGAAVGNAGIVRFRRSPQGTEVHVDTRLRLPIPGVGRLLSVGDLASRVLAQDLRRMRQLLETGEITTTRGQSSGRASRRGRAVRA